MIYEITQVMTAKPCECSVAYCFDAAEAFQLLIAVLLNVYRLNVT